MNVLICDDERRITEQVSELLQKHCTENGMQVRFHLFDDPCAIKDLAGYDIAILDIDMGDFSGIDLARRLRNEKPGIVIIFLTNFIQYAPEGFEVQAFRYLLKTNMDWHPILRTQSGKWCGKSRSLRSLSIRNGSIFRSIIFSIWSQICGSLSCT